MADRRDVFAVALQAQEQRVAGDTEWTHNGITFSLDESGMCCRFCRKCVESAMGMAEYAWDCDASDARGMEAKLKAKGYAVSEPQPGDVVCLNNQTYIHGHIAIFGWNETDGSFILEDTSSGSRGVPIAPGVKKSPLSAVAGEVSGYYRTFPAPGDPA